MDPSKYYTDLVNSITDLDLRTVARIMTYHVGKRNAIALIDLTLMVFKIDKPADQHDLLAMRRYRTAVENAERKTRQILETLIEEYGLPVCSQSGHPGRWLAENMDEAIAAAVERENRAEKLLKSAKRLRAVRLPAHMPKFDQTKQESLF